MVQISNFLHQPTKGGKLPLLNSLFSETFSIFGSLQEQIDYKKYMRHVKRSPYLLGFLQVLISDVISDDIHFESLSGSSGKQGINKTAKFWRYNKGIDVLEATLYDFFTMGNGYNWLGALNKNKVKEIIQKMEMEYKVAHIYEHIENESDFNLVRKFKHIPATTMSIINDEYEVTNYIQRVGVNSKLFSPEEIIHLKMIPLDGTVYGFAPMEALLAEIYLLWLITQNNVSFFENGGNPDKVFVLPKEIAGSKNHSYLIETLKKYKKIQNRHGNLVFTGEIQIEDLMKAETQMQHKELGLYVVGVLAMFYGIPSARIPFLVGKAANMGDAGGLADSGYWRRISTWQSKIEECYNTALFEPYFNTRIKFARGYKQDEVRETQNEMQKTTVAQQRIEMGLWTVYDAGKYMGIDEEVIDKAQKEMEKRKKEEEQKAKDMMNEQQMDKDKVINNDDVNDINERRGETQDKKKADKGEK